MIDEIIYFIICIAAFLYPLLSKDPEHASADGDRAEDASSPQEVLRIREP